MANAKCHPSCLTAKSYCTAVNKDNVLYVVTNPKHIVYKKVSNSILDILKPIRTVETGQDNLKGNIDGEQFIMRLKVGIKLEFPHLCQCILMSHSNAKCIATNSPCTPCSW